MSGSRKWRFLVACSLISLALLPVFRMSVDMIFFHPLEEIQPGVYSTMDIDELRWGWTQLCLAALMVIVTWIPFRRGELWAWLTLWIFLGLYAWPVLVWPSRMLAGEPNMLLRSSLWFLPIVIALLLVARDVSRQEKRL